MKLGPTIMNQSNAVMYEQSNVPNEVSPTMMPSWELWMVSKVAEVDWWEVKRGISSLGIREFEWCTTASVDWGTRAKLTVEAVRLKGGSPGWRSAAARPPPQPPGARPPPQPPGEARMPSLM